VAEEVTQLYNQAVVTANRKVGDRFIFGGYQTEVAPVNAKGEYLGDTGEMMVEVSNDVFISMNVPGVEAFNTQPTNSEDRRRLLEKQEGIDADEAYALMSFEVDGKDDDGNSLGGNQNLNVFSELRNLRISLLTGDSDGIKNTLETFDTIRSYLVALRAKVGSRLSGMQNLGHAIERQTITNSMLKSNIEDADMAEVMSNLAQEETVFRTVLGTSKNLIQPTLMDFLR
jgi:flagellar hook-associated protein 3 FlgL